MTDKGLQVKINNFRCWNNLELNIPPSGIIYIEGGSGKGKTTIISAIIWCFYGRVRKVAPKPAVQGKTMVKITTNNMVITRTKPKHLTVVYQNQRFEGDVAQSLIDEHYGSYDIWSISSNFKQGVRNNFLTSPTSTRMDYLHLFAYKDKKPSNEIQKLVSINSKSENLYKEKLNVYNDLLSKFSKIKKQDIIDEEAEGKILLELGSQIDQLEKLQIKQDIEKKRRFEVEVQLSKLVKPELPLEHSVSFSEQELEKRLDIKKQRDEFAKKYPVVPNQPSKIVDQAELDLALINKGLCDYRRSTIEKLGVKYDKEAINNEIKRLKSVIESQPYLVAKHELDQIFVPEMGPETVVYIDIDSLKAEKSQLEVQLKCEDMMKKSTPCPECKVPLFVDTNFHLSAIKIQPSVNTKERLVEVLRLIKIYEDREKEKQTFEELSIKRKNLEDELKGLDHSSDLLLTKSELELYRKKYTVLQETKYIPEPKVDELSSLIKQQKLFEQYEKSKSQIDFTTEVLESDLIDYITVKKYNESLEKYKHELEMYEIKLETLSKDLVYQPFDDPQPKIKQLKDEMVVIEEKIKKSRHTREMVELHKKITDENDGLEKLYSQIEVENQMSPILRSSEKRSLENKLERINETIEQVTNKLFEEDITLQFVLEKENKINKKVKRGVELLVHKNNGTYDFDEISHGEGDRLSFALTLAFNHFSTFPVMTADEPFAFVDPKLKEAGIEVMKTMSKETPIIITGQGFVSGMFDTVINIENM